MWLFLIGGTGLAVFSMIRDYRSSKSEAVVNGIPVAGAATLPMLKAGSIARMAGHIAVSYTPLGGFRFHHRP